MKISAALCAAAFGYPWLRDPKYTSSIYGSVFFGGKMDCGKGVEPARTQYLADALVVPGAGIMVDGDGDSVPNPEEQLRLEAAAKAYADGLAPYIVLLNGRSTHTEVTGKIVRFLNQSFRKYTKTDNDIPAEALVIDEESYNTASNMEVLAGFAKKYNLRRILMATSRTHVNRAVTFACNYGVSASPYPVEDTVIDRGPNPGFFTLLPTYLKEGAEMLLLLYDHDGTIPKFLKKAVNP